MTTTDQPRTAAPMRPTASGFNGRVINLTYIGYELRRNLRMVSVLLFTTVLPVAMYLIFGAMQDFTTTELANGRGNVSAEVMVSMAAYGAITAVVGLAGTAAIELQQGWGRQLGLTPFRHSGYIVTKVIVALVYAIVPIAAVFAAGALTSAQMDAWVWPAAAATSLAGSVVFALYGLAFGLLFRSEAAVSGASAGVVLLMFLGNAFSPLSGFLLDLSPYTPVWGVMQLAKWPLSAGEVWNAADFTRIQYELWQPLLNVAVWAVVFTVLCLFAARRHTSRR